jgi:hypothetical protein
MAYLSVRVSEDDKQLMIEYARYLGVSVSEMIRGVFYDRIDEEEGLEVIRRLEAFGENERILTQQEVAELMKHVESLLD